MSHDDQVFLRHLTQIEQHYTQLPKFVKIRVEKWVEKLCEPLTVPRWKTNRNAYSKLLLKQVLNRDFREPFDRMPEDGPLATLPSYLRQYCDQPSRDAASKSRQPFNTFWDQVYQRVQHVDVHLTHQQVHASSLPRHHPNARRLAEVDPSPIKNRSTRTDAPRHEPLRDAGYVSKKGKKTGLRTATGSMKGNQRNHVGSNEGEDVARRDRGDDRHQHSDSNKQHKPRHHAAHHNSLHEYQPHHHDPHQPQHHDPHQPHHHDPHQPHHHDPHQPHHHDLRQPHQHQPHHHDPHQPHNSPHSTPERNKHIPAHQPPRTTHNPERRFSSSIASYEDLHGTQQPKFGNPRLDDDQYQVVIDNLSQENNILRAKYEESQIFLRKQREKIEALEAELAAEKSAKRGMEAQFKATREQESRMLKREFDDVTSKYERDQMIGKVLSMKNKVLDRGDVHGVIARGLPFGKDDNIFSSSMVSTRRGGAHLEWADVEGKQDTTHLKNDEFLDYLDTFSNNVKTMCILENKSAGHSSGS